ncbi:hypothetical protein PIIN_09609 [Serendipita indica DSM 11827]|uniref:CxC2-like cysteine cluster KDZ transposase-associated domain-containing protein n=1 Tax=Serendipita indica (strain DSM 11827) TaxID=1109443 RepID=G4TWC5_SERID|nr:hypothetical protein PIIN_09609 [Serendipita indica DSM 11827]
MPLRKKRRIRSSRKNNHSNLTEGSDDRGSGALYEPGGMWMLDDGPDASEAASIPPIRNSRSTRTQNHYLAEWLQHEALYAKLLVDQEFPAGGFDYCSTCQSRDAIFLCSSCHGNLQKCRNCMISSHTHLPFHRLRKWNGRYLEDASLASVGLVTYLGHSGSQCTENRGFISLCVLHLDGFHTLSVNFCHCLSIPYHIQLFQSRLFPSSFQSPQTAFTFDLLAQFRIHHLEEKGSAYTYIRSLCRLTNDVGPIDTPHTGAYGSTAMPLPPTISCPACPTPGVNVPINWEENCPVNEKWKFRRFLHVDGNFRLVSQKKGWKSSDHLLWSAGGFFANFEEYKAYLGQVDAQPQEKSDCSDYRATSTISRTRFGQLEVTGVVGAVCRHECAVPNGFVDLHHGERYASTDFAIANMLQGMNGISDVAISYDIACQYKKRFNDRFARLPHILQPFPMSLTWLVPKFHLISHQAKCQVKYSFNYCPGVGRTDGEAIERFWSAHNILGSSTKRMTPESRMDTLNFHFNDWNWQKLRRMGSLLSDRLEVSLEMIGQHEELFTGLCEGIGHEQCQEWIVMEEQYQHAPEGPSIYHIAEDQAPTRAEILRGLTRFDLAVENEPGEDIQGNPALVFWVNDGIDIEETQRHRVRVRARTVNQGDMDIERVRLNRQRANLRGRIVAWLANAPDGLLDDYEDNQPDIQLPEDMFLPLPSTLVIGNDHEQAWDTERQLRKSHAFDCLKTIRKRLIEKLALQREQRLHNRGQAAANRSSAAMKQIDHDIAFHAGQYRTSFAALQRLGGNIPNALRHLEDADVSATNVIDYMDVLGHGYDVTVSWIWQQARLGEQVAGNNWIREVLRVQFLNAKANFDRWREEKELVWAEFKYTRGTFLHLAHYWSQRAVEADFPGAQAHACAMEALYTELGQDIQHTIEHYVRRGVI